VPLPWRHFSSRLFATVLKNGSTTMSQRVNPPYGEPGGEFAQRSEQLRQASVLPKIDFRSPDSLTPNPRNPRTHSRRQIRQIAESIKAFGHLVPILIDEKGVILAGHGRLAAANLLGLRTVPTVTASGLSEVQKRAFLIADNRLAEKAGWDKEILEIELQGLVTVGFDVEVTGFEVPEVDLVLDAAAEKVQDPGPEDDLPDVRHDQPAVTRPGDLWLLGPSGVPRHRLLAGDARDPAAIATLMGEEQAAMVITDPPYNVPIKGHVSGKGRARHGEFAMASGEMTEEEFISFLKSFLVAALMRTAPGALLYVFMDWRHLFEMLTAARALDLRLINICVWNKSNGGMGSLYRSKHELVLVLRLGDEPHRNNVELGKHGRSRANVWDYPGVNVFRSGRAAELAMHPTVKPVALIADAIRDVTKRGDLILDPFGGAGTVIIAAEKTGRRAGAIEIDCHYCDVAIRRWETFTGKAAVLAATSETFEDVAERRENERSLALESAAKDIARGEAGVCPGEALCSEVVINELQR
jgi:DNA modification methylase